MGRCEIAAPRRPAGLGGKDRDGASLPRLRLRRSSSAPPWHRIRPRRPSRARSSNCSPARAARPVRRPTSFSASSPRIRRLSPSAADRLLGLSRLEGHAGRSPPHRPAEGLRASARRPRGLHAADGRQRQPHVLGSDKAAIERAIAKSRKNGAMSSAAGDARVADGRLNVAVPCRAATTGGEVWLFRCPRRCRCDRARREQRPHGHLPQRGAPLGQARRLERQARVVEPSAISPGATSTRPPSCCSAARWKCPRVARRRPGSHPLDESVLRFCRSSCCRDDPGNHPCRQVFCEEGWTRG